MSTTIDSKVVEMRFDNRHFEKNVQGTMSTLDKLKEKLNLKGAAKGLENINTSASKVNMSGMSNALTDVSSKFSALEVMGVTALANITNSAVNAGKRIISALTIDPVADGWREYEMTLNAVQTTMAGTGKTAEEVEKELKKLDEYADKTVYSTADMLNNLPKFTNAGVELQDATKAMIGIANATALAGGDAGKASIAFYNLGQAIGTGYLTRMDYNSINNAGIATMEWKNQMVEAAIAAGTLKKVGEDSYKAGNKTLTLQQLFIDGLQEQWATTDVMMKVFGDYGDETTKIGTKAYAAAQDIKTFSQMMESLKATAGTGWKDTWQIVFGGLDEAKEFWTGLSNFISKIITGMSDFRNYILESALGRSFGTALDKIKKPFKEIEKTVNNVKNYAKVVDEIINGKWGNGQKRWDALTKAGYDWKHAQNLVNEELGFSLRRATDYSEKQKEVAKSQAKVSETTTEQIIDLIKLSDAQLKAKGYTDEQIKAFRELEKVSKQTGIPLKEFIENIDEIDGRWILINAFKNAGQGLVAVFKAMKDAWLEIFPADRTADGLFNIIAGLHKFSTILTVSDDSADKLKRTLKGVFAILDMVFTLIGGPIKIAVKILFQFLKALDIIPNDILGVTATIGDAIVAFHDWLDSVLDFTGVFKFLAPYIKDAAAAVVKWVKGLGKTEAVKKFTKFLTESKEAISDWFKGLKESDNIAKYIFEGLLKGLSKGAKGVIDFIINFGTQLLDGIKKVLGIHSPSTEFFEIGKNIVQGLFNGISSMIKMVYSLLMSVGGKLIDIVKNLDLGSIFTIAMGTGSVYAIVKIAKALEAITSPMEIFADIGVTFNKTLKKFNGVLGAVKFRLYAESLKTMAVAIAILAGSIVVLTMVDQGKMWSAVGAIVALAAVLGVLAAVSGKIGGKEGVQFGKLALTLLALGTSMLLISWALKSISKIDPEKGVQTLIGFVAMVGAMAIVLAVANKTKIGFQKLASTFLGMASALLMMALVAKILGGMDPKQLHQGGRAIGMFSLVIVGLMLATKLISGSKNVDKIGKTISKIGAAILMMAVVAKILGNMDEYELKQGYQGIVAFGLVIVGLMAATKLLTGSKNVDKIGKAILGISAALLLMSITTRILSTMEVGALAKGIVAITFLGGIVVGLMAATKLIGKDIDKVGRTILMLSISIGLLGITATLLSLIDIGGLAKGIIAVGFLAAIMSGLIMATKNIPQDIMGTVITLTVAIGVLALSIGILSVIDPSRLGNASLALGLVLGMFALVIKAANSIKSAMGTIIVLTLAIGALAGSLYLLSELPADRVLASSAALSVLLLAMGGVMTLLSAVGGASGQALLGVLGIAALCIPLYMMVDVLSKMQNIQNASANATALGVFMGVLAVVQLLCAAAGAIYTATGGMAMLGILGMVGLVATLYLLMGALAIMSNIPNAISNLEALKSFIITMTGVLVALAIVGPLAMTGVSALASLIGLITVIGALAVAIGFLMEKLPSIQGFLDTGVSVLVKLAEGVGKIIGAFASGLLTGLTSGLPQIGKDLSAFMLNATPFIMGARMIDSKMMEGVKALAESILILTGANVLESLTSWLTGGNSLADFGAQLGGLGTHLNAFVTNLGAFSEAQVTTVTCACNALKTIAEAADTIPNEGGVAGFFAGENSIGAFAQKLPGLGTHLNKFVTSLGTFSEAQVTTVDCAGKAIVAIAKAADEIPNEGGVAAFFAGENSIGAFAQKLPGLGTNLNQFVTNLGTFSDAQVTTVDCAGKAITALSKAASQIPNDGGLAGLFAGENDISVFGKKLPGLAKNISSFVSNLGVFSEAQVSTVNSACAAIKSIAKLGEINIKSTGKGMSAFGDNMVKFAKKVKSFVEQIGEVGSEGIDSAISKTKELINMAKEIAGSNIESLKTFGDSLKKVAKDGVKGFVKEFSGMSPKAEAKKATKALLDAAIDGAENKRSDVKKKFESIAESAVDAMSTKRLISDATQAGKDLVIGFANGIKNNKSLASDAGSSLGKAALDAAKKALDEHSPSREAMKVGNFFGQGLVIGIEDYETKTYNAGYGIADKAKEGLSRAISKVSNLISNGVDAEPVIRPVLDLSDIENGAGYLNTLFNNGPSIGVESNLRAISSGMNSRLQNGANDDVVSAINKLSKNLGKVGGDTYNLNGITYDDGSNISDAVGAIVRAAKMERRT